MTRKTQQGSPALPQIRDTQLRRLIRLMATLESIEDGTYTPGSAVETECHEGMYLGRDGIPLSRLQSTIANLSLVFKRIADYPFELWDSNPLVISTERDFVGLDNRR